MFKRILVAIDGSPTADQGLTAAIQLAADQRATLYVVHVLDDLPVALGFDGSLPAEYFERMIDSMRQAGTKLLDEAQKRARDRGIDVKPQFIETVGQRVAPAIVAQASKEQVDVIVLGTHGRRGVRRMLLGSDAEAVLRESPVPVLLVRAQDTRPSQGKPAPQASARTSPSAPEAVPISF